mmetsp:Transcript_12704/g.19095  ORF Transcript_12704/g.19095 Transcript_12704/m.19095 type:complete len:109 (+) Transcript_12704:4952-5278(+)
MNTSKIFCFGCNDELQGKTHYESLQQPSVRLCKDCIHERECLALEYDQFTIYNEGIKEEERWIESLKVPEELPPKTPTCFFRKPKNIGFLFDGEPLTQVTSRLSMIFA